MRNKLVILICLWAIQAQAQKSWGTQQLCYTHASSGALLVPMVHYTSGSNWYAEARYNYDATGTFGVYLGHSFTREGTLSGTVTPVIGGLAGKSNGGSVGVNMDVDFGRLFFSSQWQYTCSLARKSNPYLFGWSELGVRATSWLYGGMALQETNNFPSACKLEPGCMVGITRNNWSIPIYWFNETNGNAYMVVGISWQWQRSDKNMTKLAPMPLHSSKQLN